jgi:hypothetical protein
MSGLALRNRFASVGSGARRVCAIGAIVVAAIVTDSLRFTLVAPSSARLGNPVTFTLRLTNGTARPVEAHFLGRTIAFDIVVAGEDQRVVWRRLAHAVVPGILQVRTLKPLETLKLSEVWRQEDNDGKPVGTGTYTVWGVLPSDEPEPRRTTPVKLRITR